DPIGVIVGSLFGYSVCTAIAVLGGSILAQIISIRMVTLIGGLSFLTFAGLALNKYYRNRALVGRDISVVNRTAFPLNNPNDSKQFEERVGAETAIGITGRIYDSSHRYLKLVATDWESSAAIEGTLSQHDIGSDVSFDLLRAPCLMAGQVVTQIAPTVGGVCLVFDDSLREYRTLDGFEVVNGCHPLQHNLSREEDQNQRSV
ncbi:unnamed protein product, partial [Oppiella nova]